MAVAPKKKLTEAAYRMAEMRNRNKKLGLVQCNVKVHKDDVQKVRDYAEKLRRKRHLE